MEQCCVNYSFVPSSRYLIHRAYKEQSESLCAVKRSFDLFCIFKVNTSLKVFQFNLNMVAHCSLLESNQQLHTTSLGSGNGHGIMQVPAFTRCTIHTSPVLFRWHCLTSPNPLLPTCWDCGTAFHRMPQHGVWTVSAWSQAKLHGMSQPCWCGYTQLTTLSPTLSHSSSYWTDPEQGLV